MSRTDLKQLVSDFMLVSDHYCIKRLVGSERPKDPATLCGGEIESHWRAMYDLHWNTRCNRFGEPVMTSVSYKPTCCL